MTNKFGLTRYIDAETKRQIRLNSGFSCVICRAPFCTYEHFNPEFKDAKSHNPNGMCLLCSACQADTTAGRLSKSIIAARYEVRKSEGQVDSRRENFLFFDRMPTVKIGESSIERAETIVCTDSIDCLSFSRDKETGTFLINMSIYDAEGQKMLEISNNTWSSDYAPWDFEFSGKVITFRSGPGQIMFRAVLDAEENLVEITHLDMVLDRSRVRIEEGDIIATRVSNDGTRAIEIGVRFSNLSGKAAVFMDNRDDVPSMVENISLLHNSFGGITIGRGASVVLAKFSLKTMGIAQGHRPVGSSVVKPNQSYVAGELLTKTVQFPFWSEEEFFLNGVKLDQRPNSVDDYGKSDSGRTIELFLLGVHDAYKFTEENGLIAHDEADLPRPPKRPCRFL